MLINIYTCFFSFNFEVGGGNRSICYGLMGGWIQRFEFPTSFGLGAKQYSRTCTGFPRDPGQEST